MNQRDALRTFTAATATSTLAARPLAARPHLKITDVKITLIQPGGDHMVIVKVLTSEPGLYGEVPRAAYGAHPGNRRVNTFDC